MIIKYKNFIIEEERNCCVVTEIGIKKKGGNIGEEYNLDQFYPRDLQKALESVFHRLSIKKVNTLELEVAIKELKEMKAGFITDIENIINK